MLFRSDTFTGFINVIGSSTSDSIIGDSGNNSISAGIGADTVEGGLGSNTLDGGDGVDVLTYQSANSAITINLWLSSASGTGISDSITSFENVIGSSTNDSIIGDAGNNSISAGIGSDTVEGGLGSNTLDGGDGVDVLTYQSANSAITINLGLHIVTGKQIGRASCRERV